MNRRPFMKIMILNYLIKNKELTGYDFMKFCHDNGIPASSGNVYPNLKTLEDLGIITFREEGKKKIYTLTEKGEKEIKKTALATVPEFLKNTFFKNMSLTSTIDWENADDLKKLLSNVEEIRGFLETYIKGLTSDNRNS